MSCLAITPSAAAATANSAVSFPMTFAVSYSAAVASVQAPPSPTDSPNRQNLESGRRCDTSIAAVRGRAVALARQRAAAATAAPTTQHRQHRARKSVKFAMDVDVDFTHPAEDYDRSSLPMAKLNFRDFAELLQIRASIRRQAEETLMEATQGRVAKGNLPAMQARGIVQC